MTTKPETAKKAKTKKTKTSKPKLIGTKALSARGQNHDLRSRYEIAGFKVKVSVHLDGSYDFQHRVSASVWSQASLEWKTIATLHYSEVGRVRNLGHADRSALETTETELLKRAAWALS